jgi:VWFA-related protein
MTCRAYFFVLGLLLALSGTSLQAQQVGSAHAKADPAIRLDVVVTDRSGKPVTGLPKDRFKLLDNGAPQEVRSFREVVGPASAAEVLIVVDAVNTPYTALTYQRDQISKYLRANEGQLEHVTNFAVLTDKGLQMFDHPSRDGNELASALDHVETGLRIIGRDQGFYGAQDRLTISLNALREIEAYEKDRPVRKLVVWVSPGWPLLSGPNIQLDSKQEQGIYKEIVGFSTQLRDAEITLDSVNSWGATEGVGRANYYEVFLNGVKKPGDAQLGNLGLQVLALQSGGQALNSSDVVGMVKQSVGDADDYYEISFEPAPADKQDEYHKIQVQVDGLRARTRASYYMPPQQ